MKEALVLNEPAVDVSYVLANGYVPDLNDVEIEKLGKDPFLIAAALAGPDQRFPTLQHPEILDPLSPCRQRGLLTRLGSPLSRRRNRVIHSHPVGLTGRRGSRSKSSTDLRVIPWGEPDPSVGRTGATRGYPVGRTGPTTSQELLLFK